MSASPPPPPPAAASRRTARPSSWSRSRWCWSSCSSASGLAGWAAWALPATTDDDGGPHAPPHRSRAPRRRRRRTPRTLARFYEQKLDWRSCGGNECARLTVPLDYADPDGQDDQARGAAGPGRRGAASASGSSWSTRAARAARASTTPPPGRSPSATQLTPLLRHRRLRPARRRQEHAAGVRRHRADRRVPRRRPRPRHPGRGRRARPAHPRVRRGLPEQSGDLARHISTVEAAKDMDILRAALGERQLDYLGASYGTLLGATYADLFPDARPPDGARRRDRPVAVQRAAQPRPGRAASRPRWTPTSRTASTQGDCVARRRPSTQAQAPDPAAARRARREPAADRRAAAS